MTNARMTVGHSVVRLEAIFPAACEVLSSMRVISPSTTPIYRMGIRSRE
jgi:hypothetical protein